MLVDNAIVVIESIFRNQEKGMTIREAAITGTSEVAGAVIASTLTTIVVFLPIVYLHGASGELFKDQAWTVTFSLVSSLFVAILVIPMLYDRITGRPNPFPRLGRDRKETDCDSAGSSASPCQTRGQGIRITGYSPLLRILLRRRWVVIGCALMLLLLAVLGAFYRYGVYAESREQGFLCRYQVAGGNSVGAYCFGCRKFGGADARYLAGFLVYDLQSCRIR